MRVLQVEPNKKEEQFGALVRIEPETSRKVHPLFPPRYFVETFEMPICCSQKGDGGMG